MRKYDVTGIGLNLGTAEDFVRKTGVALPKGQDISQVRSVKGLTSAALVEQLHPANFGCPSDFVFATADMCCLALHQPALVPHGKHYQPTRRSCLLPCYLTQPHPTQTPSLALADAPQLQPSAARSASMLSSTAKAVS